MSAVLWRAAARELLNRPLKFKEAEKKKNG